MQGLLDYPTFNVRLLKRCLQKTACTVFGGGGGALDSFLMTEFIMTCLKDAEHRNWMQSGQSPRREIETGDPSLPGLVEVVSNIIGVLPLIVYYLKETGNKHSGDSLVVCLFLVTFFHMIAIAYFCFRVEKKRIDGYFYIDQLDRMKFRWFHLILEISWFLHQQS